MLYNLLIYLKYDPLVWILPYLFFERPVFKHVDKSRIGRKSRKITPG